MNNTAFKYKFSLQSSTYDFLIISYFLILSTCPLLLNDQGWASRQLSRQGDNGLMPTTCCLFWRCTPILATRGWHRVVVPLKVKLNRQYANVSEKRQRLMSSLFFLTAVSSYIKLVMRVWHGCSFYLFLRVPNVSWAWESVHLAADNSRLNAKNLHIAYNNSRFNAKNLHLAADNSRLNAKNLHLAHNNSRFNAKNLHLAADHSRLNAKNLHLAHNNSHFNA